MASTKNCNTKRLPVLFLRLKNVLTDYVHVEDIKIRVTGSPKDVKSIGLNGSFEAGGGVYIILKGAILEVCFHFKE